MFCALIASGYALLVIGWPHFSSTRDFPVLAQAKFFRRGVSGQWRDELPGDIVAGITAEHGAVMKRHGYLA